MSEVFTGHTRLGCLLGSPVAHSISPMMYNDSFRQLQIDYVYLCFDVRQDGLKSAVETLRAFNVFGFNLTMPDKEAVIPYLDCLSEEAKLIGAVNTVNNENGVLKGYNTDGAGYMQAVKNAGCDITGKEMTLMGAGGAAAAIAVQAALNGLGRLHLAGRQGKSWKRAQELVDVINANTACHADLTDLADTAGLQQAISSSVLLTNATSAGMAPGTDATPLPAGITLDPSLLVSDIIYNPRQTRFLREASACGCSTFNGLEMLLCQGETAFRIWTGRELPTQIIRERYF